MVERKRPPFPRELDINGVQVVVLENTALLMDDIKRVVADYYRLAPKRLVAPGKHRHVARPRQVFMWLCRQLTNKSYPQIARYLSGKDHTTVMSGVRTVDKLIAKEAEEARDVVRLLRKFSNVFVFTKKAAQQELCASGPVI